MAVYVDILDLLEPMAGDCLTKAVVTAGDEDEAQLQLLIMDLAYVKTSYLYGITRVFQKVTRAMSASHGEVWSIDPTIERA